MAIPGIPPSKHRKVFRVIDDALRAASGLRLAKVTIQSWTGERDDSAPPTDSKGPWIRLTPVAEPSAVETENLTDSPLGILLEVFVAGTNADDAMDLWGAVVAALFPNDRSVQNAIEAAGGYGLAVRQPSFGVQGPPDSVGMLGAGRITVMVQVDTAP